MHKVDWQWIATSAIGFLSFIAVLFVAALSQRWQRMDTRVSDVEKAVAQLERIVPTLATQEMLREEIRGLTVDIRHEFQAAEERRAKARDSLEARRREQWEVIRHIERSLASLGIKVEGKDG